ncbi:hypothetical protein A3732_11395, partial [Oleiphilus sp. HI0050]
MKNYYFISSPLHFFIASNLAIENQGQENIAVIVSKNLDLAKSFTLAIEQVKGLFQETVSLANDKGLGKIQHRREVMKRIDVLFASDSSKQIYTGNDRRVEFQYAMHVASQSGRRATGIYMDDGAVSYIGHKSMNSFAHRFLDPFLKKLVYGTWWKNALTIGSSAWISKAYLAFPEYAHPLLQEKKRLALNTDLFSSDQFKQLSKSLLDDRKVDLSCFDAIKVLITLPHEASYMRQPDSLTSAYKRLLETFSPRDIGVKAHPRSTNLDLLDEMFPGSTRIDKNIGFELILPLLGDDVLVLGDISTTLLSAKWLRPDIRVETLSCEVASQQMNDL